MNEYKEAWKRINEYVKFVRRTLKPERTERQEAILRSYEELLIKWAEEKTRPARTFVKISFRIVFRTELIVVRLALTPT